MKGNVSKIVSDKGAASEQYIDATVGTALKNSKEAKEDALAALDYSEEALRKTTNAETTALQAVEKSEAAMKEATEHINNTDIHLTEDEKWNISEMFPTVYRMAEEANDTVNLHRFDEAVHTTAEEKANIDLRINDAVVKAQNAIDIAICADTLAQQVNGKVDKPTVFSYSNSSHEYEFNYMHNHDIRNGELTILSFTFGNGEYVQDYISGLSFDSGATPTAIDYTDSGILNWVGTDCVTSDGLSIFQPSANTHYDILFYFNGVQFIGLVNGFVPATGNEAV